MISYDSTARLNQPAARTNDSDLDVPSSTRIHDPVVENREPDGASYDVPTDDNSLSRTPDGWERYIHPNGLPYYVNQTFHAVTWLNIQDSTALDRVEGYIKIMNEQIKATGGKMPKDWEMRVELSGDVTPISDVLHNGKDLCHKLLNHSRRRVFELKAGCEKPFVVGGQYEYWTEFQKLPMHHTLPAGAEDDMLTALTHYYIARINLDLDIISPFSHTQCQQLLSLFETIKQETTSTLGIRACFVSSVLATIWETRQQYHWGEYDAKSSFIQTGNLEHPTLLRRFLEAWIHVLCFGTHGRYLVQLKLAQANGSTYRPDFDKFLEDLLQEWTDSNLLGTVFVSANMAFLAVGEITKSQQTIVLLSTFFSMASIVSGVHHIWKHRPKTNADADESRRYITRANILFPAMFLSFPLVFLLWSVLTFAVALLDFAFFHSQVVPRVLIACIVSFILFTTVCMRAFFYNIWEEPDLTDKSTGIVKRSWHALQRLSAFRHDESDETSESDASSISSKKVDTRIQRLMVGIQNLRRTKNTTKGAHV